MALSAFALECAWRFCARYVSLLRYVAQWRYEKNEGYDALVIFAHSQGTSPSAWDPAAKVPENVFVDGPRTEFAIGPGAHTHYWDKTGDQVAERLDAMIARV